MRAPFPDQYSISASLMAMSMAITLGIREQYALASIFMLTFATQTYGFLTEWSSTPKAYVDKQNYKHPVGPYQRKKFAEGAVDYGVTNYREDPNALKLIDQTEWFMDRPMYEVNAAPEVMTRGAVGAWWKTGYSNARAQRTASWLRRMVPSIFGWFTMTSVWFILFTQLGNARRDIAEISDRNIPEWVYAMIVGTALIFMSFALVLVVFQRLRPGIYWGALSQSRRFHKRPSAARLPFLSASWMFVRRHRDCVLHPVAHRQAVPRMVPADQCSLRRRQHGRRGSPGSERGATMMRLAAGSRRGSWRGH